MFIVRICFTLLLCIGFMPPAAAMTAQQLAIVVNADDPQSKRIADYYQLMRGIPDGNIISVNLPVDKKSIGHKKFEQIYQYVKDNTPSHIQFYALAWSQPYKVGCMSMTSAFAFGFDDAYSRRDAIVQSRVLTLILLHAGPIMILASDRL